MYGNHTNTRLSAYWPFTPFALTDVARWSELVTHGPFERLWIGQSVGIDAASAVAYAAGAGRACPLGIAVNVIPMHHPVTAAQQARSMVLATGHNVTICFSPGDPFVQQAFTGQRYRSPLGATREFLAALRGLVDGQPVTQQGAYFPVHAALPSPALPGRVRLGLGTLRPAMTRLAGEIADSAVTWLTPPAYLRDVVVPALDEGAHTVGRTRPELIAPVHAILDVSGRDPMPLVERAVGTHLRLPHYQDMLRRAGEGPSLARGPAGALDSGLVTHGSADDIAARVLEVADAGANEVPLVLHQPSMPWRDTRAEWLAVGERISARIAQHPAQRSVQRPAQGASRDTSAHHCQELRLQVGART